MIMGPERVPRGDWSAIPLWECVSELVLCLLEVYDLKCGELVQEDDQWSAVLVPA